MRKILFILLILFPVFLIGQTQPHIKISSTDYQFQFNGVTKGLTNTSTGNVGIGLILPHYTFDVYEYKNFSTDSILARFHAVSSASPASSDWYSIWTSANYGSKGIGIWSFGTKYAMQSHGTLDVDSGYVWIEKGYLKNGINQYSILDSNHIDVDTIGSYATHVKHAYIDTIYNEPPHCLLEFDDSSVTISAGTNVQITNTYDSLFRIVEPDGAATYDADTATILFHGAYNILAAVYGTGTLGSSWRLRVAYKRGSNIYYSYKSGYWTTNGGSDPEGQEIIPYIHLHKGDKVWLVLTRRNGSGDFVAISGSFDIQSIYREP